MTNIYPVPTLPGGSASDESPWPMVVLLALFFAFAAFLHWRDTR